MTILTQNPPAVTAPATTPATMRLSALARSAATRSVLALLDGGVLAIYGGPRPHDPDVATTQSPLVALHFASPAFGPPVAGVADANPISPGTAQSSGEARSFRCLAVDGRTVLVGRVGTDEPDNPSPADLLLNCTAIQAGATVAITGFQYAQAA